MPKTVSLIIPAKNEAENISQVLTVAKQVAEINEIIVVADNCDDNTEEIARGYGVKILNRAESTGKGSAMIAGAKMSSGEIIMFADADLINLTAGHLKQILNPILFGEAVMSVGLRDRIFGLGFIIPKLFPMYAIGGERAMTREFFASLPHDQNTCGFGIETVMNFTARNRGLKVAHPVLKNLHQIIKEKKWGFWPGLTSRIKLLLEVEKARIDMKHEHKIE